MSLSRSGSLAKQVVLVPRPFGSRMTRAPDPDETGVSHTISRSPIVIKVMFPWMLNLLVRSLSLLLFMALAIQAWVVSPDAVADQGGRTRDAQLREFQEAFKPGYSSYMGIGWMLLPKPSQATLQSPYGIHDGFAFRHRFALMMQSPLDSSTNTIGWAWWVERQGWDVEDFIAVPKYSAFGLVRDVHTFSMLFSSLPNDLGVAGGVQWTHPEHVGHFYPAENDSLWWFTHGTWKMLAAQAEFKAAQWTMVRVNVELAARALRHGDSTGWHTYLPDMEAVLFQGGDDPLRLWLRQNIWTQRVYVEGTWWPKRNIQRQVSLLAYADPSQMVGVQVGVRQLPDRKWMWGGGVEFPFMRVSCNLPGEYDQFFHAHGNTWLLEVFISLGSIKDKAFFRRNAPRSAPMETDYLEKNVAPIREGGTRGTEEIKPQHLGGDNGN